MRWWQKLYFIYIIHPKITVVMVGNFSAQYTISRKLFLFIIMERSLKRLQELQQKLQYSRAIVSSLQPKSSLPCFSVFLIPIYHNSSSHTNHTSLDDCVHIAERECVELHRFFLRASMLAKETAELSLSTRLFSRKNQLSFRIVANH